MRRKRVTCSSARSVCLCDDIFCGGRYQSPQISPIGLSCCILQARSKGHLRIHFNSFSYINIESPHSYQGRTAHESSFFGCKAQAADRTHFNIDKVIILYPGNQFSHKFVLNMSANNHYGLNLNVPPYFDDRYREQATRNGGQYITNDIHSCTVTQNYGCQNVTMIIHNHHACANPSAVPNQHTVNNPSAGGSGGAGMERYPGSHGNQGTKRKANEINGVHGLPSDSQPYGDHSSAKKRGNIHGHRCFNRKAMEPIAVKGMGGGRGHEDSQPVAEALGNNVSTTHGQQPSLLDELEFIVNLQSTPRFREQEMAETTVRRLLKTDMGGEIRRCDVERVTKTFSFPEFVKLFDFADSTTTKLNFARATSPSESEYKVYVIPIECPYLLGTIVVFRKTKIAVWYDTLDHCGNPGILGMLPMTMNSYRSVFGDWKQVIGTCNKGMDYRTCGLFTIQNIERLCSIFSKGDWEEEPNLDTLCCPEMLRYKYALRLCTFHSISKKFEGILASFKREHFAAGDESRLGEDLVLAADNQNI